MSLKISEKYLTRIAIYFVLISLVCAVSLQAATIQLPRGTKVKVKFAPGMRISSGELAKDIPLLITLAEPIMIGSKMIVEEGAQGTARVAEVEKAKKAGKPGYIKVEFVELETKGSYQPLDESKIKLTGNVENKGKSKKTLSYLFIFGLFIKGGQGEIATDKIYTATVAETLILEGE